MTRDDIKLPTPPVGRIRQRIYSQQGLRAKRSAAQQANTLRQLHLLTDCRGDYNVRANGQNSQLEGALLGDLDAKYIIKRETPVHRSMVNMAAAGYTAAEIAKALGWSQGAVANVLRQPHSRQYLINEAKKTVQDDIKQLLQQEVVPSLQALVRTRDSEASRPSDVISASNSLLDRALGKATANVTIQKAPAEMSDEELKAQVLAELAAQQPN
ncbi:MAG: hypothetical protein KGL39_08570 [Patescibacteria group bacterium]|nr:hypothetical protein [Patescibacteria group bacterium]